MTNRQFANLANRLLPEFPNFAVKSPLMFLTPIGHTLRGFCFESHRSSADYFYVWVFLLPIFIPPTARKLRIWRSDRRPLGCDHARRHSGSDPGAQAPRIAIPVDDPITGGRRTNR